MSMNEYKSVLFDKIMNNYLKVKEDDLAFGNCKVHCIFLSPDPAVAHDDE